LIPFPVYDAGKIADSSAGQMPGVCTAIRNSNSYPNKLVRSTSHKMILLTSLSFSFYCFVTRESTILIAAPGLSQSWGKKVTFLGYAFV
jgi:hypothetical protein